VDARRRGPLGALLEEDLGERVGREGLVWVGQEEGLLEVLRVVPREEAGAGRGFEPPRADGEGRGGGDDGRGREAVVEELGELLIDGAGGFLDDLARRHGREDGVGVAVGVLAQDGLSERWGQADLPEARDDLAEARGVDR
jgi:hypothetical protein